MNVFVGVLVSVSVKVGVVAPHVTGVMAASQFFTVTPWHEVGSKLQSVKRTGLAVVLKSHAIALKT